MTTQILTQTTNLLRLYKHLIGKSEVPIEFHMWSFISLLGACAEDRVWYEKGRDNFIAPNLYIFLIGSAATGKGTAIRKVHELMKATGRETGVLYGSTTKWDFEDYLSKPKKKKGQLDIGPFPKTWLVTEELSDNIGKGFVADAFFKTMMSLYTNVGQTVYLGTRTGGRHIIESPCVSWLMGSNEDDLIESLDKNSAGSGFFSRVAPIIAFYNPSVRFWRPISPPDYDEVKAHIIARLWQIQRIKGQFVMSELAQQREQLWYYNRREAQSKDEVPNWKREQDLVLKLCMILSLADGGPLVIKLVHLEEALKMSASVQKNIPRLVELSNATPGSKAEDDLLAFLRERALKAKDMKGRKIRQTELGERMRRRFGMPSAITLRIVRALIMDGKVKCERDKMGATWYWTARKT